MLVKPLFAITPLSKILLRSLNTLLMNDMFSPIDFQQHFKELSKRHSPVPRPFYFHLTSVIDTRSTAMTLATVEEGILREHLRKASLM